MATPDRPSPSKPSSFLSNMLSPSQPETLAISAMGESGWSEEEENKGERVRRELSVIDERDGSSIVVLDEPLTDQAVMDTSSERATAQDGTGERQSSSSDEASGQSPEISIGNESDGNSAETQKTAEGANGIPAESTGSNGVERSPSQ